MKAPTNGYLPNSGEGEKKSINSELWHACAGPLVSLPPVGSLVIYFPQGHSEQVAASMQKETDCIPSYPNLPSKLICMLHNVTLHADPETDEVYAQMTLQPVNKYDKEAVLASDMGLKQNRQPAEFFCKTLTASDTSTHGGFSVPRRAAEKIFPPLDFTMQPPAQELVARDLHDNAWTFKHIYRGQPKRHLLTTGWSVFVSTKRLFAGDSVLFIRDEKSQFLLGLRRANRQLPALSSSVISSDSMHIGILAAAAHAAANNSPFTIFYNPRASPCEFVIPLAKYNKAMYAQVSLGMRFRMMFETEDSGVRRYMGTITGVSDLDPMRWKSSQWRNLQVGWDESTAGERPSRVSIWEIEPVVTPFYICPPTFFRPKFPKQAGFPDDESDMENAYKRGIPWLGDDFGMKDPANSIFPGLSLVQWMNMQQNNQLPGTQSGYFPTALHNSMNTDDPSKLLSFQSPVVTAPNLQFNKGNQQNQVGQFQQQPIAWSQQQQLQQLLKNQNPINQHQQSQQPLQHQQSQHQNQQQQPLFQQNLVNNGIVNPNQMPNTLVQQQSAMYAQLQQQQQQLLAENTQSQQSIHSAANRSPFQLSSLPQELNLQQQMEQQQQQQPSLLQKHQSEQSPLHLLQQQNMSHRPEQQPQQLQQLSQQNLAEQQIQLQMLQKMQQQHQQQQQHRQQQQQQQQQQQHQQQQQQQQQQQKQQNNHQQQQLFTPVSPRFQPQMLQQQNQQIPQLPVSQNQQLSGNSLNASAAHTLQHQFPTNNLQDSHRPATVIRAQSGLTEGDAPSCSTSPSTNNCQISTSNFLNRNQKGAPVFVGNVAVEHASNLIQELQSKPGMRVPNELSSLKGPDHLKYKSAITDQLEGSSSATSYCMEGASMQPNFSIPASIEVGVQSHHRSSIPYAATVDGLAPDTLLSRGFDDSGKDLQNLLSNYGGTSRDFETELSAAAINSQSFGMPDMSLAGCANDVAITDNGLLSGGIWGNQTQRMRTYTKVQKRGSVGRSVDVTRYKGYDELRHDLAHMFGIEGQLDDPQRTDWKLVYVDHENDILLVGDDPWEEFVSCVQAIKILSSAEVEQMSLDGDLGHAPIVNQACSGTDSGNVWKANYDDHSATSFNR